MKKMICTVFALVSLLSAQEGLFSGIWVVKGEGISLSFLDSTRVSYDSDDNSVQGEGVYTYTDSTLTADIVNDGMDMKITYRYKTGENDSISVKTMGVMVDGDSLKHSEEWYDVIKKERVSDDKESEKDE